MKFYFNFCTCLIVVCFASGVHAETIDFDDFIIPAGYGYKLVSLTKPGEPNTPGPHIESGFSFTPVIGALAVNRPDFISPWVSHNGTQVGWFWYPQDVMEVSLKIKKADNGLFRITSIDLAEVHSISFSDVTPGVYEKQAEVVTFEGVKYDGTIITASHTLNKINDGYGGEEDFETFIFPSDWYDLKHVIMTAKNLDVDFPGSYLYFDNIVVDEVTNEPPIANAGLDQSASTGDLITLDGSGSLDPDNNNPISYAWTITQKPEGSSAALIDANTVNPTFEIDLIGDYIIELVVTDALGAVSAVGEVVISTTNTRPYADANGDRVALEIGGIVTLDGSGSYDDDGDEITYQWTIVQRPLYSTANLVNANSVNPTLTPDLYGDYIVSLVVSDHMASSAPDQMKVSFENVPPVADPGPNMSGIINEVFILDGSKSSDLNLNVLSYDWQIVAKPSGSATEILDATDVEATVVPDLAGEYVISLTVFDGLEYSPAQTITIAVLTAQDATTETLQEVTEIVDVIPPEVFKNPQLADKTTNKINSALIAVDDGKIQKADKQLNKLLQRYDGCALRGEPDKKDWIQDCDEQLEVYQSLLEAIELLGEI